jgi:glutamate/tyrosine decarboxylase-like PLP-dependent enzyme
MSVDMSAEAIDARLREASRLAGALRPEARLETKIDMSGPAVATRLKQASDLLDLCRTLSRKE